jgi:SAM-dependent methyltransferase
MTPQRIVQAVKRHPRLHRIGRGARFAIGHVVPPRRFADIPGRVHANDFMMVGTSGEEVASYAERAQNVMRQIEASLSAAGRSFDDVQRWLDFGCGYGRVIRFLVERVPPERVAAGDVIGEAVRFCHSEFGVMPIHSDRELAKLRIGTFDFIYAISVITHLDERNSIAFLRLLGESLTPGGVALFTTHGAWSVENPGLYGDEFEAAQAEIARSVRERGTAFLRYPFAPDDYGVAWHGREFIEAKITDLHGSRLELLRFEPHGLDGHQDVFTFRRVRDEEPHVNPERLPAHLRR